MLAKYLKNSTLSFALTVWSLGRYAFDLSNSAHREELRPLVLKRRGGGSESLMRLCELGLGYSR